LKQNFEEKLVSTFT